MKRFKKRAAVVVSAVLVMAGVFWLNASQTSAAPQVVKLSGNDTGGAVIAPGTRSGAIYSAAFAPDGKTLASGDDAGHISLWDTAKNQLKVNLSGHKSSVNSLAWSPKGDQLLSAGQCYVKSSGAMAGAELKIWDMASGKPRLELAWPDFYVELAAWSPDGKVIALTGSKSSDNKLFPLIELRDAASGKLLRTLKPSEDNKNVCRLQFSPDSRLLLTLLHWVCEGSLWNVESGKVVREIKPAPELKIPFAEDVFAFSPDSKTLARGRFDGSMILEDTRSGELIRTFAKQPPFDISEVRFSEDGKTLWSLNAFQMFAWNPTTGALISQTECNSGGEPTLSSDGSLITGHGNRNLYLIHVTP